MIRQDQNRPPVSVAAPFVRRGEVEFRCDLQRCDLANVSRREGHEARELPAIVH